MTDSLKQVAEDYKKVNPKEEVVFSFASSSTLAKQIEEGAPADLFISASTKWMKHLSDKGLTVKETEKLLVGNELVLISQKRQQITKRGCCERRMDQAIKKILICLWVTRHTCQLVNMRKRR